MHNFLTENPPKACPSIIDADELGIPAYHHRHPLLNNGAPLSFYESKGPCKDYMRNSQKNWERVFVSWWVLDWRVGEDKKYGRDKNDGTTFYTSLKPWAREQSDMRDFASFLNYWGWKF